jgi:hypothetical protein
MKKLLCWLFGHDFQFDEWEFYWKGHKRCQRCGKWDKENSRENKKPTYLIKDICSIKVKDKDGNTLFESNNFPSKNIEINMFRDENLKEHKHINIDTPEEYEEGQKL